LKLTFLEFQIAFQSKVKKTLTYARAVYELTEKFDDEKIRREKSIASAHQEKQKSTEFSFQKMSDKVFESTNLVANVSMETLFRRMHQRF
jgi:hypothetical protein